MEYCCLQSLCCAVDLQDLLIQYLQHNDLSQFPHIHPIPWVTTILFCFYKFIFFQIPNMSESYHTVFVFPCLAYLTQHNAFWFHICMLLQMVSRGCIIFHCVSIPLFLYPFIDKHLNSFHILPIVNKAAIVNMGVQVSCFYFLWMYNQKWNCWILWQFLFLIF